MLALRNPTDLSEPDPALFAELPTALQPQPLKAGAPPRGPLEGIDRAQAGLTTVDLANGGPQPSVRSTLPVRNAPSSVPRVPSTTQTARVPRGADVEFIRGDKRETLSY